MEYYIAHHGVPHQKWGVRNGPPYPLDKKKTVKIKKKLKKINEEKGYNIRRDKMESYVKTSGLANDFINHKYLNYSIDDYEIASKSMQEDEYLNKWLTDFDLQASYALEDANKVIKENWDPENFDEYAEYVPWALFEDQMYYDSSFNRYLKDNNHDSEFIKKQLAFRGAEKDLDNSISNAYKDIFIDDVLNYSNSDDIKGTIRNIIDNEIGIKMPGIYGSIGNYSYPGMVYDSSNKETNHKSWLYWENPEAMPVVKEAYEKYKKL